MVEMSGVEKFGVEKSGVEKFLLAFGLKNLWLKLRVEKSGVEMSYNHKASYSSLADWSLGFTNNELETSLLTIPPNTVGFNFGTQNTETNTDLEYFFTHERGSISRSSARCSVYRLVLSTPFGIPSEHHLQITSSEGFQHHFKICLLCLLHVKACSFYTYLFCGTEMR